MLLHTMPGVQLMGACVTHTGERDGPGLDPVKYGASGPGCWVGEMIIVMCCEH